MKNTTLFMFVAILALPALSNAQIVVGETKEMQEAQFTVVSNLYGPDHAVKPLELNKRRAVPTAKGWSVDTEWTVKSSYTVDSKGKPKYAVYYQYGGDDAVRKADYDPVNVDDSVHVRTDAHLVSAIRWHLTRSAEDWPLGDHELIIYVRQIEEGRSRDVAIVPLRGHDVKEDRAGTLTFTGVDYRGPSDAVHVLTFLVLRNQEEARTGDYRTTWFDIDGPALDAAVSAMQAQYAPASPVPAQPQPAPPIPQPTTTPATQPQPPVIPPSYGSIDYDHSLIIIDAYDRDIIVSLDNGLTVPVKQTLKKGEHHRYDLSKVSNDQLTFLIEDAATGEILEKINYIPQGGTQ